MTDARKISSLLIPMQQKPLLVPAACVVDIVDYTRPSGKEQTEDWYLGDVVWRGLQIPLIAFERLNQRRFAEFSASARLAVLNTVTEGTEIPFYAIVIQGVPQPLELLPADLQTTEGELGIADRMQVTVNQLPCCIPNFELVDQKLKTLRLNEDHPKDTALA
ncbi:chemotaxis protein CheW [Endozoicomonas montiporae]|uniref:CheW-like domain-containing protein n=1 Tax=Endozoicomonas montiporae CL-33 TaxID=570277 RepID=A0A142B7B2_9GAMM|nr:chemotaxis protein CheW [Endozoicomonas montiporae]AMO54638.1 CheW-like domain-containing protein [Endozoicomonas montiporae CL-33]